MNLPPTPPGRPHDDTWTLSMSAEVLQQLSTLASQGYPASLSGRLFGRDGVVVLAEVPETGSLDRGNLEMLAQFITLPDAPLPVPARAPRPSDPTRTRILLAVHGQEGTPGDGPPTRVTAVRAWHRPVGADVEVEIGLIIVPG